MTYREFQVYVVEVCRGCGWNHLIEQYLLGRDGLARLPLVDAVPPVPGRRGASSDPCLLRRSGPEGHTSVPRAYLTM